MSKNQDIETLIKLYRDGLSLRNISELASLSTSTVKRRLRNASIPLRDKNDKEKKQHGWWQNKSFLHQKYEIEELSTTQIGELVGVTASTVRTWLAKLEIETRAVGGAYKVGTKMSPESRKKMSIAKKGKYLGADNPNWKGSKVTEEKRLRQSYENKLWRQACLIRDQNQCTKCGDKNRLHVHHILPFADHPERRFDINNGQTLCVSCHEDVHKRKFPDYIRDAERVNNLPIQNVKIKEPKQIEIQCEILSWLYEGNSTSVIAEMFSCNSETIRKKLNKCGIDTARSKFPYIPNEELLRRVYLQNTLQKTAQHFGVGQTLLHKWLKHYGIAKRDYSPR